MVERWRVAIFAGVLLAHVVIALWLPIAMAPPAVHIPDTVLAIELFDRPPAPPEPEPEPDPPLPAVPPSPVSPRARRPAPPMQAVIETPADAVVEPDAPREFVAPERDPFSAPSAPRTGFGRRDAPAMPPARGLPRIAGEAPPDAPLQGMRLRRRGTREIVEFVGALIGGGPNAPAEVRCGNRLNGGGVTTAESFAPAWQQHYGCSDTQTGAGYDGRVEVPDNIAR